MNSDGYSMWLTRQLDTAVQAALHDTRLDAVRLMKTAIPEYRVLTRRAVRVVVVRRRNGYQLRTRLHFSKTYRVVDATSTARIFHAAWREVKPQIVAAFQNHFNKHLRRI